MQPRLVTSYILSQLDFCNCLLMGTPNSVIQPLQKIQNFAARLVLLAPHHHHWTPLLEKLHWLPISECIKYKVTCMCFSAIGGSGPAYLSEHKVVVWPHNQTLNLNSMLIIQGHHTHTHAHTHTHTHTHTNTHTHMNTHSYHTHPLSLNLHNLMLIFNKIMIVIFIRKPTEQGVEF